MQFSTYRRYLVIVFLTGIIVAGSFWLGFEFGKDKAQVVMFPQGVLSPETEKPQGVDFSLFWKTWDALDKNFVDNEKIDTQKLVWGAISGMVKAIGDPYTVFLPPQESKRFADDISGSFGGIGAEIGIRGDVLTIISPLKDSPDEKAGLLAGDKILQISGTSTQDMIIDTAVGLIRGPQGTKVTLLILRRGTEQPFDVVVTRDVIRVPTVKTQKLDEGVFIISLYNFNAQAPNEFRQALLEGVLAGSSRLVIDARNNPGGYLESAVDIASWFLPRGALVAKEEFGDGRVNEFRSRGYHGVENWPVVMLINGGSASASEILAGALRDGKGVFLVGEKTFGKGSVQELVELPQGASLKVTIAKWLTPNGVSIADEGLEPDHEVQLIPEKMNKGVDSQLLRAIELLKSL